jgi:hypothetical protein
MSPFERAPFPFVPLPGTAFAPDVNGWQLWWARYVEGARKSLAPVFVVYMETYREAEAASARFSKYACEFASKSVDEWLTEDYDLGGALSTIDASKGTLKATASGLLLALDGMLTDLRVRLRGKEQPWCTCDGPELRNGVTVDRALDAVGNYIRHEYEWQVHDYRATFPEGRELKSIIALARLSTSMPIEEGDSEAAYEQYTLTRPALMVLDLLCEFERDGPSATYATVERKMLDAGNCTILKTFESRSRSPAPE